MIDKTLVNFETFKRTRNLDVAERNQRIYNWVVKIISEYVADGKLDDAYDLLVAGLMVKENATTDYERKKYSKVLEDVGKLGYEKEEKELRWRLQKYLKLDEDK